MRWNVWRVHATWGSAIACLCIAAIVGTALLGITNTSSFPAFFASSFAPMLWLVATVFTWRESKLERTDRVTASATDTIVCPACGYNLTGLSEARCPECGARYTLNELFADQPSRELSKTDSDMLA